VVAALIASTGRFAQVPCELRLHVAETALPAFAAGRVSADRLCREMREHWWHHTPRWADGPRGAHAMIPPHRWEAALGRLEELNGCAGKGTEQTRLERCAVFVRELLDPFAAEAGAVGWVEKSPDNCMRAGFLSRLFEDARVVHVVRDGRDVACSLMRVPWGPETARFCRPRSAGPQHGARVHGAGGDAAGRPHRALAERSAARCSQAP